MVYYHPAEVETKPNQFQSSRRKVYSMERERVSKQSIRVQAHIQVLEIAVIAANNLLKASTEEAYPLWCLLGVGPSVPLYF